MLKWPKQYLKGKTTLDTNHKAKMREFAILNYAKFDFVKLWIAKLDPEILLCNIKGNILNNNNNNKIE